ncbi:MULTISPECIES: F0F1 ATP synthase subunit delta [Microbacterium]|jgi:F-type H+-transporting ATPase subunit delta|uniref:F0F1 ATP synthase subunit delta n=1 Tax=Microbacterium TaxID=33882 RepID=UPI0006FAB0D4|nr:MULTISPECIES: F0F1 ATP synthase subunit delta [unclassified Microbacterium]MBN9198877.1 F0F1 ATP synthase subunit delta [Microbacterium ginsengisoli]MCK9919767.1 F0F1 ATP synthase subunit delta [Microbacteriaceae bacterium K1510]KQR92343.1 ATP synthase F0F1 subunit delta [Microbacterium sp. Leaf351]KQR92878.1 ATP synthase F0F1 subunit delta [Microbacterium sp. Leaf347]ODU72563.1 MAG: ATP synthase F1 subunit delta [Microbacterium sp. SCN 71-21]
MGAATTHAQEAANAALSTTAGVDLTVATELFQAARALAHRPTLAGALADWAATPESRAKVVEDVFGAAVSPVTRQVLAAAAVERWSSAHDFVFGVEELAVRAASKAAPSADVEGELFRVSRTIADNPQLELALGSRLGDAEAKGVLVETLLGGRASEATTLIVSSLVRQPGERRVREVLSRAMRVVAAERERTVATVVSAVALTDAQTERLGAALAARYGTQVSINTVIDESIVGGLRIQIANDVIDASVSTRLADLRHRLAG